MLSCLSRGSGTPEDRAQQKNSKEIDQMLAKHGKQFKQEIKLLLLGSYSTSLYLREIVACVQE